VKLVASIAMKERLRFAIREGGKIRGAGVAKDKSITLNAR
jgi:translation elongation factor EF-Tu-like GTPase